MSADRLKDFQDKDPVIINKNVSSASMLNSIYQTTLQSKPLYWYNITYQVGQGYSSKNTQHRYMLHSLKKLDITVSLRVLALICIKSV